MPAYKLPSHSPIRYRGVYPDRFRSFSWGSYDIDGVRCLHVETYAGERFTIPYAYLNKQVFTVADTLDTILLRDAPNPIPMSQAMYDVWLRAIREGRGQ